MSRLARAATFLVTLAVFVGTMAAGTTYAHALSAKRLTNRAIPNSCTWYVKASKSANYYSGSTFIGSYTVYIYESSCQASVFLNGADFDGTGGGETGCQSGRISVAGSLNNINESYMGGSQSASSFGASASCSYSYLEWDANNGSGYTVPHGTTIASNATPAYAGSSGTNISTSYYFA